MAGQLNRLRSSYFFIYITPITTFFRIVVCIHVGECVQGVCVCLHYLFSENAVRVVSTILYVQCLMFTVLYLLDIFIFLIIASVVLITMN